MFTKYCIAITFLFHFTFTTIAQAAEVKFATFNTYWLYDDKEPFLNWASRRGQSYNEAIQFITDAILAIDADVIALQEIEGEHILEELTKSLKSKGADFPYFWSNHTLDPFTGQSVGIISKFPNVIVPVRRYQSLVEEYVSDRGQSRMAAIPKLLRVDLNVDGKIVTVFATHLKSQRGGNTADHERFAQAKMLRRIARVQSEKGDTKNPSFVVVMGDLNDIPESRTLAGC